MFYLFHVVEICICFIIYLTVKKIKKLVNIILDNKKYNLNNKLYIIINNYK